MRTVRLVGELGKKYGEVHRFKVKSPAEAIRALAVNFPEFERDLRTSHERNVGYKVINAGEELETIEQVYDPASREIVFIPVVMGAGAVVRILAGAALIAAGFFMPAAAPYLWGAGAGLVLGGIVQLLSPVPKAPKIPEKPENTPSYNFNGPVNTTAQGHPVPLGYGRLVVGGALISAGISIQQLKKGFIRKTVERTTVRRYYIDPDTHERVYISAIIVPPRNYFKSTTTQAVETFFIPFQEITATVYTETFYWYDYVLVEA